MLPVFCMSKSLKAFRSISSGSVPAGGNERGLEAGQRMGEGWGGRTYRWAWRRRGRGSWESWGGRCTRRPWPSPRRPWRAGRAPRSRPWAPWRRSCHHRPCRWLRRPLERRRNRNTRLRGVSLTVFGSAVSNGYLLVFHDLFWGKCWHLWRLNSGWLKL